MIQWNKIPFALLLMLGAYTATAQDSSAYRGFQSRIYRDSRLDAYLDTLSQQALYNPGMKGYRIQLFTGSERKGALDLKSELQKQYPRLNVYIIYQQPYFKLRVGDYRSQAEAQPVYQELLQKFGKAFIVPDDINLPDLD